MRKLQQSCGGFILALWLLPTPVRAQPADSIVVAARGATTPVNVDADDVALWRHPDDAERSLIIGTDKGPAPDGGLFVWDVYGTLHQQIPLNAPNNVDVRAGVTLGGRQLDLVIATMRQDDQLRVFQIDRKDGLLIDITASGGIATLPKPYGIALYHPPGSGLLYAFVSSEKHDVEERIWQIQLRLDAEGKIGGEVVRRFDASLGIVEGMVADDTLGYVYFAEEYAGIHKFYADPQQGSTSLAFFAAPPEIAGKIEGVTLFACGEGRGYLLASNPRTSSIKVYTRETEAHGVPRLLATIFNPEHVGGDGVAVLGDAIASYPGGLLAWHDESIRAFKLYSWLDIARQGLAACTDTMQITAVGGDRSAAPAREFRLLPNYPNPFNGGTLLPFVTHQRQVIRITVFRLDGQMVRQWQMAASPGSHEIFWDGRDARGAELASGVYVYKLESSAGADSRKLLLLH